MSNERVLVVDDEPAIRRLLKVTLTSQAYTVLEAASGQEAITGCGRSKTKYSNPRPRFAGHRWRGGYAGAT